MRENEIKKFAEMFFIQLFHEFSKTFRILSLILKFKLSFRFATTMRITKHQQFPRLHTYIHANHMIYLPEWSVNF